MVVEIEQREPEEIEKGRVRERGKRKEVLMRSSKKKRSSAACTL